MLDEYNVGEMLGQGAFGIVYACKPRSPPDKDCAVKMVDKVETPVDKIKEEAEMLRLMDHNNVIKCHDVIYEKCFVCIVMDRLRGGDLIVGMQAHWKSKGKIPVNATIPISAQMASSLHYLHGRSIIHRDVKGDNYLCDRNDIADEQCRIVLTDFGTAVPCTADQRLTEKCGTKLYWSPEFVNKNYSLKVDIWAMGVVVYGLLNGKFPFRDDKDIINKQVTVPKGTPSECNDFVMAILEKNEGKRADSAKVVGMPWIKNKATSAGASQASDGEEFKPDLDRAGEGNEGIQDRRKELIDRMEQGAEKKRKSGAAEEHYWKEWFSIVDRHAQNSTLKYEWWSQEKVKEHGLLDMEKYAAITDDNVKTSKEEIARQLRDHGVDINQWGKGQAKTMDEFVAEIDLGSAVLMNDASDYKQIRRVVDVVLVRISAPGDPKTYLIETSETFADGRKRDMVKLPGTKKEPHENSKQVAERVVKTMMDIGGNKVTWVMANKEVWEDEEESPSYPGVRTVYRKECIPGVLSSDYQKGKSWEATVTNGKKGFTWKSEADCIKANMKVKVPDSAADDISGLVQAPIGMNEEKLFGYLQQNGIDVTSFGKDNTKSLKDFSAELTAGESALMVDGLNGKLIRVVDLVVIKLLHSVTQSILVQTEQTFPDKSKKNVTRLPGAKRRPDENQFLTARRILKRQLKIEEHHVTLETNVKVVEEEGDSKAYPGIDTKYRKRILLATLAK